MESKVDSYVSYVAFLLGYDFMGELLSGGEIDSNDVFDLCMRLASEYVVGVHDLGFVPINCCLKEFIKYKIPDIEAWAGLFGIGRIKLNTDFGKEE